MFVFLRNGKVVSFFTILTMVMAYIVMFRVNPAIDHNGGMDVLKLQLAFTLDNADVIVKHWKDVTTQNFIKAMGYDYLYAFCYSMFFASLFAWLLHRKGLEKTNYRYAIGIAFAVGLLDWFENSVEILYMMHSPYMNETLFLIHSIAASLKWLCLPVAFVLYVMILKKENK